MAYALYTYHWRANSIRKGGRGPYDDRLGPVSILYPWHAIANFKLQVLDNPLRRASRFGLLSHCAPKPHPDFDLCSVCHSQLHPPIHRGQLTTRSHLPLHFLRIRSMGSTTWSPCSRHGGWEIGFVIIAPHVQEHCASSSGSFTSAMVINIFPSSGCPRCQVRIRPPIVEMCASTQFDEPWGFYGAVSYVPLCKVARKRSCGGTWARV
jgi:hypothetical protein